MTSAANLRLVSASVHTLPEDYVAVTGGRLALVASITAGIHVIYLLLYRTVWIAEAHNFGLAAGLTGLVASLGCAAYLFRGPRTRTRVTAAAVTYEILLTLSLALSDAATLKYDTPSAQVPWGAVVIVLFPYLIPAAPRVVLAASAASAAMTPLGMACVFGLVGRPWPEAHVTLSVLLPGFACALLAWAPTKAIHRLSTALQQARTLGSYELSERLGGGGMGEVWRAQHRLLARPAAVKLIKPEMLGAQDDASRMIVLSRFEQEAKVTANLSSPHTVELYDFGVSSDGELYYVMELLDGVDAETLVERFGRLPSERVAYLLMQACDSLDEAHGRGLVHRDVKPANLFVSRKGVEFDFLKVLDFGLVKRWDSDDDENLARSLASVSNGGNTAVGKIVGSPAFLAPEAAVGVDGVDGRADLYALGCVGYWLLTASNVFDETTAIGMAVAHVTKTPELPSARIPDAIEPALEQIVMRCLAKNREERPASARELRELLSAIRFSEPWSRERASLWWQEHLDRRPSGSPRGSRRPQPQS